MLSACGSPVGGTDASLIWMFFQQIASRSILLMALAGISGGLIGCANPGQPRPPSLRLPEKAQKVAAERVGDEVIVSWTTPAKTTDKDLIRGNVTAVICRDVTTFKAGSPTAVSCNPARKVTVAPGVSHAETIPADPATGPITLLAYRVELLNSHGRSAGTSDAAFVAGGAGPPPVGALTIRAQRQGALVMWRRSDDPALMHLTRTLVAAAPDAKPVARAVVVNKKPQPLGFAPTQANATVVTLEPPPHLNADPGGLIDHSAQNQTTYRYVAERVAAVEVSGHMLEMHGLPSPPATFTYRDVFPPSAPMGLVSVPGGGFGVAPSIDLSWDPNPETNVLGYNVYRREQGTGGDTAFLRLNAGLIPSSAFRDLRVEPGRSYVYRVTAVDQQHNESAPGGEINETLRK